jgi:nicotinamidase-related amidase
MPHPTVHLLIDMVNPFDFEGAKRLFPQALQAARQVAAFKQRLRAVGVPTVYVNDNFGHWELGFRELVDLYRTRQPSAALLEYVEPGSGDHFILKPKHSAFYATSLEVLLARWSTRRLILTGIAGNICVMFTAHDAHMREYKLIVPADCVASEEAADNAWALQQMQRYMRADIRPSAQIDLPDRSDIEPVAAAAAGK